MVDNQYTNMNHQTEEAELISLMQKGNKQAFTTIYNRYHKPLYVLAYTYLKDRAMAEDAIQHVFARLWEFREETIIRVSLKNFLYTITKNHILNRIRNENNLIQRNYQFAQTREPYEDDLLRKIEENETKALFRLLLETLPEQKRQVCLLKMDGELSNGEIAEKMRLSVNTVKTHYAQAIKLLKARLDKVLIILILLILF